MKRLYTPVSGPTGSHGGGLPSERRQAEKPDDDVKRRGPGPGGPAASRRYSASHTVSSWQFRKWLGVIDQPRTLERYGTMRFHWNVMM
jgi:hypothetical protein